MRTLGFARPAAGRLILATLLGACSSGASIGLIATSAWLISRSAQRPPESAVAIAIVGVQFFALSRGLFRYAERLAGHDAAFRVLRELRVELYRRLERLAPLGLPAFRRGDLLARLVHDIDCVQDLLLRALAPFAIALIVGAATVGLVWWMLPAAGVILLCALLIAGALVPCLTAALARRAEAGQAAARGELTASVVDLMEGAHELLVNGASEEQLRRTMAADAKLSGLARASARTTGIGQGLTVLLSGLAMWGILLVGVAAVRAGRLDGVLLAGLALIPLVAFELVSGLPAASQSMQRVRRAAARVFEVIDAQPPIPEPARPLAIGSPPHTLTVRGLRTAYLGQSRWALDGLDLDLGPGRTVAVVGPSGAGKSTLAGVLMRFLPYQAGSVALDGIEIDGIDGDEYRRVVGLVSQDPHVFDNTLEENLRLAKRDASCDELRGVLEAVGLLEWTEQLPAGLQTHLGDRGGRLSGGQRQRLALARALLADFPVLLLDEPGEHLDTPTADAIIADLLAGSRGRATLLITHRLLGLQDVDEVLVLDHGAVVERGTHAELVGLGGRYAALWLRQRGYAWGAAGPTIEAPSGRAGGAETRPRKTWKDQAW
ncbi:MAG TPA: thiol reductant ABC exporter subunit CydC [Solirubrobacteraceae bacterium]|jgi:thiol reductant ABC exporter CydC subunit|nr:thiol reductant ABC exporter subunit CydC [Solirubrobacteraceae bacterium]